MRGARSSLVRGPCEGVRCRRAFRSGYGAFPVQESTGNAEYFSENVVLHGGQTSLTDLRVVVGHMANDDEESAGLASAALKVAR